MPPAVSLPTPTTSNTPSAIPSSVSARLAHNYGVRDLPNFMEGKVLKEAIREANAAAKYLVVYLHGGDHEDTYHFATSVLGKPPVVEKLNEIAICNFVDAYSREGADLERNWAVSQLPYCCLLVKGRVVGDLQGRFSEEDFLDFLSQCDDVARPIIHQEVAFVYERNMREQLRIHQEAEMAEAERLDRENLAAKRKEAAEKKEREAERIRTEALERAERVLKEKEELAAQIEKERREAEEKRIAEAKALEVEAMKACAASALPDEPSETAEASTVAKIRLVDLKGRPSNRSFYRTDKLSVLFTYAKTIEGYSGETFALMAGFPPKALDESAAETTIIGDVPSLVPRSVVTMKAL